MPAQQRTECVFCGDELWSALEASGICCSCQGMPLDEAGDADEEQPYDPPECMSCEDTGYEPGMPGYYCTFCKAGCKVATEQLKAGRDPFDPHGTDQHKRPDADG